MFTRWRASLVLFLVVVGLGHPVSAQPGEQAVAEAFQRCQAQRRADPAAAARCLEALQRSDPGAKHSDVALYNAVVLFEAGAAPLEARHAAERLVTTYPRSAHALDTLYLLGAMEEQAARFSEAAAYYARLVARDPKHKRAEEALMSALIIQRALGHAAQAIHLGERYLKLFPHHKQRAMEVAFQIAALHEEEGRRVQAERAYRAFLKVWRRASPTARLIEAHTRLGALATSRKKAEREFKAALALHQRLGQPDPAADRAAARAEFLLVEGARRDYEALQLASAGRGVKALRKGLRAKLDALERLHEGYRGVLAYRSLPWSLAAMYQSGFSLEGLVRELQALPLPPGLSPQDQALYRTTLDEQAAPILSRAEAFYQTCVDKAAEAAPFDPHGLPCWTALERVKAGARPVVEFFDAPTPREVLGGVASLRPPSVHPHAVQARQAALKGSCQDAASHAHRALELDGRRAGALAALMVCHHEAGRAGLAQLIFERMLSQGVEPLGAHLLYGALMADAAPEQAWLHVSRAVQLAPEDVSARWALGALSLRGLGPERAVEHLKEAQRLKPGHAPTLLALGVALRHAGSHDQARARYEQVLKLNPKEARAWFNLAVLEQEAGGVQGLQRAIAGYEAYLKADPSDRWGGRVKAEARAERCRELLRAMKAAP
ncbi:MAG: hypothetical protein CMH57_03275 [Myxococcales bacterium]|nr:hypothetical protein [Myxococcales bacterium]